MKDLSITIEELINLGHGFETIARQLDIPVDWVVEVAESLEGPDDSGYDDSMDGDAASALASVGWGTDEDYGYAGDDY